MTAGVLHAQNYGNEWIDYSKEYVKIKVTRDGLHRVNYSVIENTPGISITGVSGNEFILYNKGEIIAYHYSDINTTNPNGYIEFYGEKNDGEFDTQLYWDPTWQANPDISLFNDTAVYFLTWQTVQPNKLIDNIPNTLSGLPPKENACTITVRNNYASKFNGGIYYELCGSNGCERVYRSIFDKGEGYAAFTDFHSSSTYSVTFNTPFPFSGSSPATIKTAVIGDTKNEHTFTIKMGNNTLLTENYMNYDYKRYSFSVASNTLSSSNTLAFTGLLPTRQLPPGQASNNSNFVVYAELRYLSEFNFNGQSSQVFEITGGSGSKYIEISGFNDGGNTPILYDLTNDIRIEGTSGSTPYKFKLPSATATGTRLLYLSHSGNTIQVGNLDKISFLSSNFNDSRNQGDYIIISHPKLINDNSNIVNLYSNYRNSIAGGDFKPQIVDINLLYDMFAYGIKSHPLAIRNFARFAKDTWTANPPEYFFIIGKGREYHQMKIGGSATQVYKQSLIPPFGHPGSSSLYTAPTNTTPTPNSIIPQIAISRLSVETPNEISIYLQKVKDYESEQNKIGDPFQTIADKLWTKRVMHLGGGEDAAQQYTFKRYLENYKDIIVDPYFGGNVTSFYKTSSAPIQIASSQQLTDLISSGVTLINFFGHSQPGSFDLSLDDPQNYTNYKRYPLILSNGCFTGYIYNPTNGLSENFVLAEDKGAIGFLSTVALSSSSALDIFTDNFYENLSRQNYASGIGHLIKETITDVEVNTPYVQALIIAESMTLNGDPAISLNPHPRPDYALEEQMISFDPPVISVNQDSFIVRVIVSNLGHAIDTMINLSVERKLPNGDIETYIKRVKATLYSDTFEVAIQTGGNSSFGLNEFRIMIDSDHEVEPELSETNNVIGKFISILSEDIFPIYPYEFAIVPSTDVTLKASTANAFAEERTYYIEIDITEGFNSPLKQRTTVRQSGGVVSWKPTIITPGLDSTVFYWRVGIDSSGFAKTDHRSSFIYIEDEYPGWNQSHYFQYLKDDYYNVLLDTDSIFKFNDDVKSIQAFAGTSWLSVAGAPLDADQITSYLNGVRLHYWKCGGSGDFQGGLTFVVIDGTSGQPWLNEVAHKSVSNPNPITFSPHYNYVHKCVHCKTVDLKAFPFPTVGSNNPTAQFQNIVDFINSVPNDNYILIYSVNNANYDNWDANLINALNGLGANTSFSNLNDNAPWAYFVKKGDQSTKKERVGININDTVRLDATFEVQWYQGTIRSPLIGPALEWGSFHWDLHSIDNNPLNDTSFVNIYGIDENGFETEIKKQLYNKDYYFRDSLADDYPYLRLELNTRDFTTRTPTQLDYWRIIYKKVPEAALNPNYHFVFNGDDEALEAGQPLNLEVAIENVSELDMDSLWIKYTIVNTGNYIDTFIQYDSLKAFDTNVVNFEFNTACNCLADVNNLLIEVNPLENQYHQLEQFHFNNIGILGFNSTLDDVNPLLDVTFDGIHIMDGDIVAAKPEIKIKLNDDNKYLRLDDPTLVKVYLKHPDGTEVEVEYDGIEARFEHDPADAKNFAEVYINQEFMVSGKYELWVQAADRSRNASGDYGNPESGLDYRIGFEVEREASITNVLNYPNPFTSSTRFVFTLTGVQTPDNFKIQIMTVTGKVVREITLAELGNLRVGRNITEFAWNGTDQYGDPLGNGLYLYRVVASINGEKLDLNASSKIDKYFKSGFGKMYLAR